MMRIRKQNEDCCLLKPSSSHSSLSTSLSSSEVFVPDPLTNNETLVADNENGGGDVVDSDKVYPTPKPNDIHLGFGEDQAIGNDVLAFDATTGAYSNLSFVQGRLSESSDEDQQGDTNVALDNSKHVDCLDQVLCLEDGLLGMVHNPQELNENIHQHVGQSNSAIVEDKADAVASVTVGVAGMLGAGDFDSSTYRKGLEKNSSSIGLKAKELLHCARSGSDTGSITADNDASWWCGKQQPLSNGVNNATNHDTGRSTNTSHVQVNSNQDCQLTATSPSGGQRQAQHQPPSTSVAHKTFDSQLINTETTDIANINANFALNTEHSQNPSQLSNNLASSYYYFLTVPNEAELNNSEFCPTMTIANQNTNHSPKVDNQRPVSSNLDQNGNLVTEDGGPTKCDLHKSGLNPVGPVEFLERYRNRNSSQRPLFSESFSSSKSVSVQKIDTEAVVLESVQESNEELPERGQWSGKLDFIFSCISYAVGLGNVWRFPYLCYENGGGAFLVPYLICVFVVGIPLFLMEVSLGQYFQTGGVAIWNRIPLMKGVGFASMVMIGLCNTYYIIIIAWTLYYLINSFQSPLPWASCGNEWNTDACHVPDALNHSSQSVSPAQEFWQRHALNISGDMAEVGSIQWNLFFTLILGWILVYGVIYRGIHQSGKIIWFTAIFPYVILVILFCYGLSLEGAIDGIIYYIKPEWSMLKDAKIWVAAGTQLLFTYGIGIGTNIALGSYNTHNHNFYRDSLIACFLSSGTSLFSGFVIFSILGHMAFTMNTNVAEVARSGPGLAFIVYPEAVTKLPFPNLWAILFFVMLLVLGIDSQFCTVESFITGIVDEWPRLLRPRRRLFTLSIVFIHFLLGISMITSGGMYVFQLMDNFSASGISLLIVVLMEIVGFSWIYGADNIYDNMTKMLGFRPICLLYYLWVYVSPASLLAILLFSIIQYTSPTYAGKPFPIYGEVFGWCIALASIVCIPLYMFYYLFIKSNQNLSLKERFLNGLKPLAPSSDEKNCKTKLNTNDDGSEKANSLTAIVTESKSCNQKTLNAMGNRPSEGDSSYSTLSTIIADQTPVTNS